MVMIGAEITQFQKRLRVIAWLCEVMSSDRSGVWFGSCSHTNPREKEGAVKPATADKRCIVSVCMTEKLLELVVKELWDFHINLCQRRVTKE
jgi:hypothetical protein